MPASSMAIWCGASHTGSPQSPDYRCTPRRRGHGQALSPERVTGVAAAENDEFEPIEVDLREQALVIEGVVVGVIRDGMPLH